MRQERLGSRRQLQRVSLRAFLQFAVVLDQFRPVPQRGQEDLGQLAMLLTVTFSRVLRPARINGVLED